MSAAQTPPFTIEDDSRTAATTCGCATAILDLRRPPAAKAQHDPAAQDGAGDPPLPRRGGLPRDRNALLWSTRRPEGARDFVVPSTHESGAVLRAAAVAADAQAAADGGRAATSITRSYAASATRTCAPTASPNSHRSTCEMSFVEQEDVLELFEGLGQAPVQGGARTSNMTEPLRRVCRGPTRWRLYGSDKPDLRFGMAVRRHHLDLATGPRFFGVFDSMPNTSARFVPQRAAPSYTRKQLDALTEFVKRPADRREGAGLRCTSRSRRVVQVERRQVLLATRPECPARWPTAAAPRPGDLVLHPLRDAQVQDAERSCARLRLEVGPAAWGCATTRKFAPLWVVDFPLLRVGRRDAALLRHAPSVHLAEAGGRTACIDSDPGTRTGQRLRLRLQRHRDRAAVRSVSTTRNCRHKMFEVLGFTRRRGRRSASAS